MRKAIQDYNRNEEKHKKREFRCHDPRGYLEGDEKHQRADIYKWIEVHIDIYGYYAKIIFSKTYFSKNSFGKENIWREK